MQTKPSGLPMSGSVLMPIPSDRIDDVWPQVKDRLKAAVETANGRLDLLDLYGFIRAKDVVLWVSVRDKQIEAVAVTEIIQHAKKKMCNIRIMTGEDYANWIGLEDGMAAWAQSIGCHGMEALARKGWAKKFPHYEFSHIFLERMF